MTAYNALAVLQGVKTETRRFAPKEPRQLELFDDYAPLAFEKLTRYKPGEILGISEPYYAYGYWVQKASKTKKGKPAWRFIDLTLTVGSKYRYSENPPEKAKIKTVKNGKKGWRLRIGMFMPDTAVRTCVLIKARRIENLGDITEQGAKTEGCRMNTKQRLYLNYQTGIFSEDTARASYKTMWEAINGVGSWRDSLLVCAYTFTRYEKP